MRLIAAFLLMATGLSGCAGYELEAFVPPPEAVDGNGTAPEHVHVEAASVDPEAYPVVAGIATAAFTAPVAIPLASFEGAYASLTLLADAGGLRCQATPVQDAMAAPAGYRVERTWSRCSLEQDGANTSTSAPSLAMDLPLLAGIPVEAFVWNATTGRVLVNNTGEHDEVLDEVSSHVLAAPSARAGYPYHYGGLLWRQPVCDTLFDDPVATLHFHAEAHNGLALLQVDLEGYDVLGIVTSADEAINQTGISENGSLWVAGTWDHESFAWAEVTIRFFGRGGYLHPSVDCPGAVYSDVQHIPFEAKAVGIAAGWQDVLDSDVFVEVLHGP